MSGLLLAWIGAALAGKIYINNLPVETLPVIEMRNVTVRFDAEGNIWIDAPNYQVRQVAPPTYLPGQPGQPGQPGALTPSGVPVGRWWLVTEDAGSVGSAVDVMVNGQVVRRVISGQPQLIMDIGAWLRPGDNEISLLIQPGTPAGGALSVYIGQGDNRDGTIRLGSPDVRWTRRAGDPAEGTIRTFHVTVPPAPVVPPVNPQP